MDGTLLGAVREDGHIEGSGDCDIGVLAEDIGKVFDQHTMLPSYNGIAGWFGGRPVYWNYGENPIVNVQAWHDVDGQRFYFEDSGIIVGKIGVNDTPEYLLKQWYDDWRTPQKGTHAQRAMYKLTLDHFDP